MEKNKSLINLFLEEINYEKNKLQIFDENIIAKKTII